MLHRLLLLSLLAPVGAHAIECESLSPSRATLGEQYYDLDVQAKDTSDDEALIKRATDLLTKQRFRSGHATRTICKRVDGQLTAITHKYELENAYTSITSHGDLNMKVVVEDKENRTVKTQTLTFPKEPGWLSGSNNNTLRMNHRYRVRNGLNASPVISSVGSSQFGYAVISEGIDATLRSSTGRSTSRLLEFDIELTVLDKGVGVKQLMFTNGVLVEQSNWTLFTR